jgi:hypothetical protein
MEAIFSITPLNAFLSVLDLEGIFWWMNILYCTYDIYGQQQVSGGTQSVSTQGKMKTTELKICLTMMGIEPATFGLLAQVGSSTCMIFQNSI